MFVEGFLGVSLIFVVKYIQFFRSKYAQDLLLKAKHLYNQVLRR